MQTVKPNEVDAATLTAAASALKTANAATAAAKKASDNAKAIIIKWLKDSRDITLDTLAAGDIVNIEGICLVERGQMVKFSESEFAAAHAELYAEFKKPLAVNKFKPLVK